MRKRKALAAMLAVMAMSLMALNAHADTDGTELQVPSRHSSQFNSAATGPGLSSSCAPTPGFTPAR